jgi:two-component system, NarL family, nitrate/nitrite response regulator NarL
MSQDTRKLSPREIEILSYLIAGRSNAEIAHELNISMSTVKAHVSSIYRKLGVSSRMQAALMGVRMFPMLRAIAGRDLATSP